MVPLIEDTSATVNHTAVSALQMKQQVRDWGLDILGYTVASPNMGVWDTNPKFLNLTPKLHFCTLTIEFAVIISTYIQWRISLQGVMPNFLTTLCKLYELEMNGRYEQKIYQNDTL